MLSTLRSTATTVTIQDNTSPSRSVLSPSAGPTELAASCQAYFQFPKIVMWGTDRGFTKRESSPQELSSSYPDAQHDKPTSQRGRTVVRGRGFEITETRFPEVWGQLRKDDHLCLFFSHKAPIPRIDGTPHMYIAPKALLKEWLCTGGINCVFSNSPASQTNGRRIEINSGVQVHSALSVPMDGV